MEWLAVYEPDTIETVYVCGYECSACGYLATKKWVECPHCREEWIPESEEEYEDAILNKGCSSNNGYRKMPVVREEKHNSTSDGGKD